MSKGMRIPWGAISKSGSSSLSPNPPAMVSTSTLTNLANSRKPEDNKKAKPVKDNNSSSSMDEWDPMEEDFSSKMVNSYTSGPGSLLQASPMTDKKVYKLYVSNIPPGVTKEGLRNIFSRAGDVKNVFLSTGSSKGSSSHYGFIEYATLREADAAISQLQNFAVDDDHRLKVKVAESESERHKRLAKRREEEQFLSTLNCSRRQGGFGNHSNNNEPDNEFEMNDDEFDRSDPSKPTYHPSSALPGFRGKTTQQDVSAAKPNNNDKGILLTPSYYSKMPTSNGVTSPSSSPGQHKSPFSSMKKADSNSEKEKTKSVAVEDTVSPCSHCSKLTSSKCAACKTPFCSKECQKITWVTHRLECKKLSENPQHSTQAVAKPAVEELSRSSNGEPSELVIADNSDDDGFVVSGFDTEEDMHALCDMMAKAKMVCSDTPRPQTPAIDSHFSDNQQRSTHSSNQPSTVSKTASLPHPSSVRQPLSLPVVSNSLADKSDSPRLPRRDSPDEPVTTNQKASPADGHDFSLYSLPSTTSVKSDIVTYTDLSAAFNHLDSPPPSVPLSGLMPKTFLALPTQIVNCTRLGVVPLSLETRRTLDTILEFQKTTPTSFITECDLTPKVTYGAVDINGHFFRVRQISGLKYLAVDTGEMFQSRNLQWFNLPKEISSLPELRVRASLCDIECAGSVEEGRHFLKSKIWSKVVRLQHPYSINTSSGVDIISCVLELADGSVCYNDLLCSKGFAVRRQSSKQTQPTQLASASSSNKSLANSWGLADPKGFRITHYSNKIPIHCPPCGTVFDIYPTVVVNPFVIWAQVIHENSHKLCELLEDMNAQYDNTTNASYIPRVGEVCAARYATDKLFYRAEILQVNNNGLIDVLFVDYGNRETVKYTELRHLRTVFISLPKQAIHLAMAGICPLSGNWDQKSIDFLKKRILETPIKCLVKSTLGEGMFSVELMDDTNPEQSLNQLMIQKGLAKDEALSDKMRGVGKGGPRVTIGRGSAFNSSLARSSSTIRSPSTRLPGSAVSPAGPMPGISCLTQRGHSSGPSTGPLESKSPSSLSEKPLGRSWQQQRKRSPPVSSEPLQEEEELESNPVDLMAFDSRQQKRRFPEVASEHSSNMAQGHRSEPELNQNVLMDHKRPPHYTNGLPADYVENHPTSNLDTSIVSSSSSSSSFSSLSTPTLSSAVLPETGSAIGCHVNSPELFYVQVLAEDSLRSLLEMSEQIQSATHHPLGSAPVNQLCVALYSEDNTYYRARVVSQSTPNSVRVQFLDYGNEEEIPISELFQLEACYQQLPAQAIACKLNGVKPTGRRGWSKEACTLFGSLICDQELMIDKVEDTKDGSLNMVNVSVKKSNMVCSVAELLVQQGLAESSLPVHTAVPHASLSLSLTPPPSTGCSNTPPLLSSLSKNESRDSASMPVTPVPVRSPQPPTRPQSQVPMYSSMSKVKLPSASGYLSVMVSEVINPGEFYVQTVEQADTLVALSTDLSSHFENAPVNQCLPSLKEGSICCAKFSQDGEWYRSQVLKVTNSAYLLQFIDYGNHQAVSKQEVFPCPPHLLSVPVQAVCCSLDGIRPVESKWSPQANLALLESCQEKLLSLGVVEENCSNGRYSVELIDSMGSSRVNIALELVRQDLAVSVDQLPMSSPTRPNVTKSAPPCSEISDGYHEVMVAEVTSPRSFWVHIATPSTQQQLMDLQAKLAQACPNLLSSTMPDQFSIGDHCCAIFEEDQKWYRACVTGVSDDLFQVLFIDFGNQASVPKSSIVPLLKDLQSIPQLAHHVSLAGLPPTTTGHDLQLFYKLTRDKKLFMKVLDSDGIPSVQLLDTSQAQDLNIAKEIVHSRKKNPQIPSLKLPQTPSSRTSVAPVDYSPFTSSGSTSPSKATPNKASQVNKLENVSLPSSSSFSAIITHVESAGKFYLQVKDGNESVLSDLASMALETFEPPSPIKGQVKRDQIVLTKFEGEYGRAKLVGKRGDLFKAIFVDFGNVANINLADIMPLPQEFASIPMQAVQCALIGVSAHNEDEAKASLCEWLYQIVACTVVSYCPLLVDIGLDGDSIANRLTSNVQEPVHLQLSNSVLSSESTSVVLVSDAHSPLSFFLQVFDKSVIPEFEKLTNQLQDCQQQAPPMGVVCVGQLCCAQFSQDKTWYRARVMELCDNKVKVRFVDFGNSEEMDRDCLRPIVPSQLKLPAQAIHCTLAGIEPELFSQHPEQANKIFKDLVLDKQLNAVKVGVTSYYTTRVSLVDQIMVEDVSDALKKKLETFN